MSVYLSNTFYNEKRKLRGIKTAILKKKGRAKYLNRCFTKEYRWKIDTLKK